MISAEPLKAYATFRITGDALAPEQVTRLLRIVPAQAYSKGERYAGGPRSTDLIGRTGVWYFCTEGIVAGNRLSDHLTFLLRQVIPEPEQAGALRQLLHRKSLQATLTCFRHGAPDSRRPSVPRAVMGRLKQVPVAIEMDFDTEALRSREAD